MGIDQCSDFAHSCAAHRVHICLFEQRLVKSMKPIVMHFDDGSRLVIENDASVMVSWPPQLREVS